jgi:hypothetical protein
MKDLAITIGMLVLGVSLLIGSQWLPEGAVSPVSTIGCLLAGLGAGATLRRL